MLIAVGNSFEVFCSDVETRKYYHFKITAILDVYVSSSDIDLIRVLARTVMFSEASQSSNSLKYGY